MRHTLRRDALILGAASLATPLLIGQAQAQQTAPAPVPTPQTPGFFLYFPSRHQVLPKLRAFIDFARTRLR